MLRLSTVDEDGIRTHAGRANGLAVHRLNHSATSSLCYFRQYFHIKERAELRNCFRLHFSRYKVDEIHLLLVVSSHNVNVIEICSRQYFYSKVFGETFKGRNNNPQTTLFKDLRLKEIPSRMLKCKVLNLPRTADSIFYWALNA
ncbi:hypothetical protein TNCT_637701 [Trichonephila clavata]|uniref:Uncharacterized protein n=1 Tax=Trichonephila clavata TaxID=2740835 RepID=A0A8X6ISG7_TRICU|nr:hypothetical protein TNCT_637701 [Trichonephila clavata]